MLQYLIIQLDDTSVSYCHCSNPKKEHKLINLDDLKKGIVFSMKENLNVQFVYPKYCIPDEYREIIDSVDHVKIGPIECQEELNVVVVDKLDSIIGEIGCVLWRCTLEEFKLYKNKVKEVLNKVTRLNIIPTDIPIWNEEEFKLYKSILYSLTDDVVNIYESGKRPQLNLLTDRMMLNAMNNCNAGDTTITLAPDGCFYICPAFYTEIEQLSIGSLVEGVNIKNQQLYRLDHAPLCRYCDAYQCKRCIWMNIHQTMDSNTPSHEQCVCSHIERNASRLLQQKLLSKDIRIDNDNKIEEIDYLDPFNKYEQWKQEKKWGM